MSELDIDQFSDRQLSFGYWFTKHKILIKAIALAIGYLFFGILTLYNFKVIFDYYATDEIGRLQEEMLANAFLQSIDKQQFEARALQWLPATLIDRGDGGHDLIVKVTNPNDDFVVTNLAYSFHYNGWQSDVTTDYVLPGQTRTLMATNIQDDTLQISPTAVLPRVESSNVVWQRIRDQGWYEDGEFVDLGLRVSQDTTQLHQATLRDVAFVLANTSNYNYADVEARVVLYNGTQPVGAQFIHIPKVLSGAEEEVQVRFLHGTPAVTTWDIEVSTNILDPDNILPYTLDQFE